MCDKLVAKVCKIDTSKFALKIKYQIDKSEFEKKNHDVTDLVKKNSLN